MSTDDLLVDMSIALADILIATPKVGLPMPKVRKAVEAMPAWAVLSSLVSFEEFFLANAQYLQVFVSEGGGKRRGKNASPMVAAHPRAMLLELCGGCGSVIGCVHTALAAAGGRCAREGNVCVACCEFVDHAPECQFCHVEAFVVPKTQQHGGSSKKGSSKKGKKKKASATAAFLGAAQPEPVFALRPLVKAPRSTAGGKAVPLSPERIFPPNLQVRGGYSTCSNPKPCRFGDECRWAHSYEEATLWNLIAKWPGAEVWEGFYDILDCYERFDLIDVFAFLEGRSGYPSTEPGYVEDEDAMASAIAASMSTPQPPPFVEPEVQTPTPTPDVSDYETLDNRAPLEEYPALAPRSIPKKLSKSVLGFVLDEMLVALGSLVRRVVYATPLAVMRLVDLVDAIKDSWEWLEVAAVLPPATPPSALIISAAARLGLDYEPNLGPAHRFMRVCLFEDVANSAALRLHLAPAGGMPHFPRWARFHNRVFACATCYTSYQQPVVSDYIQHMGTAKARALAAFDGSRPGRGSCPQCGNEWRVLIIARDASPGSTRAPHAWEPIRPSPMRKCPPPKRYVLCKFAAASCPAKSKCEFAHSVEELREWNFARPTIDERIDAFMAFHQVPTHLETTIAGALICRECWDATEAQIARPLLHPDKNNTLEDSRGRTIMCDEVVRTPEGKSSGRHLWIPHTSFDVQAFVAQQSAAHASASASNRGAPTQAQPQSQPLRYHQPQLQPQSQQPLPQPQPQPQSPQPPPQPQSQPPPQPQSQPPPQPQSQPPQQQPQSHQLQPNPVALPVGPAPANLPLNTIANLYNHARSVTTKDLAEPLLEALDAIMGTFSPSTSWLSVLGGDSSLGVGALATIDLVAFDTFAQFVYAAASAAPDGSDTIGRILRSHPDVARAFMQNALLLEELASGHPIKALSFSAQVLRPLSFEPAETAAPLVLFGFSESSVATLAARATLLSKLRGLPPSVALSVTHQGDVSASEVPLLGASPSDGEVVVAVPKEIIGNLDPASMEITITCGDLSPVERAEFVIAQLVLSTAPFDVVMSQDVAAPLGDAHPAQALPSALSHVDDSLATAVSLASSGTRLGLVTGGLGHGSLTALTLACQAILGRGGDTAVAAAGPTVPNPRVMLVVRSPRDILPLTRALTNVGLELDAAPILGFSEAETLFTAHPLSELRSASLVVATAAGATQLTMAARLDASGAGAGAGAGAATPLPFTHVFVVENGMAPAPSGLSSAVLAALGLLASCSPSASLVAFSAGRSLRDTMFSVNEGDSVLMSMMGGDTVASRSPTFTSVWPQGTAQALGSLVGMPLAYLLAPSVPTAYVLPSPTRVHPDLVPGLTHPSALSDVRFPNDPVGWLVSDDVLGQTPRLCVHTTDNVLDTVVSVATTLGSALSLLSHVSAQIVVSDTLTSRGISASLDPSLPLTVLPLSAFMSQVSPPDIVILCLSGGMAASSIALDALLDATSTAALIVTNAQPVDDSALALAASRLGSPGSLAQWSQFVSGLDVFPRVMDSASVSQHIATAVDSLLSVAASLANVPALGSAFRDQAESLASLAKGLGFDHSSASS